MTKANWQEIATHIAGMFMVTWLSGQASIDIPGISVPVTLQSLVVILMPMLFGYYTLIGLIIWLLSGILGLAVFAGGNGGLSIIFSNSGGFLIGFVLVAFIASFLGKWVKRKPIIHGLTAFLGLHALLMSFGLLWIWIGDYSHVMFESHIQPYLPGLIIKSIFGAIIIYSVKRLNPSWID